MPFPGLPRIIGVNNNIYKIENFWVSDGTPDDTLQRIMVDTLKKFMHITLEDIVSTPLVFCGPGAPCGMSHRGMSPLPNAASKSLLDEPVLKDGFDDLY
jgi:hypothetical protein